MAEVTLLTQIAGMTILIQFLNRLAVLVQPPGRRPVPPGFGGHATTGKGRDVAALAGKFIYVIIQLGLIVGRKAMARLTTGPGEIGMARHIDAQGIPGIGLVSATGYCMAHGG